MTMKSRTLLAFIVTVLIAPFAAQAAQPWTGAAGVATIDEQSIGIYDTYGTTLKYNNSGSTSNLIAYYNVTDTTGTGAPTWTTLELSYVDNSPSSSVKAWLVQSNPSTGVETILTTCSSVDSPYLTKKLCPLSSSVNFNAGYIYIVQVTISRSSNAVDPWLWGVRLY